MLLRWGESASRTSATHQRRVWVNSNYLALFLGHLLSSRRLRQRRFSCRSDDGWSSVGPSAAGSSEVLLSPGGGAACCCAVGRGALVSVRLGWLNLHVLPNLHMPVRR